MPATHTNSYALGDRDVLLVEPSTPYDDERRAFVEWARGLVSAGRRLVALFVTHHHEDHIGGAAFLSRELSLPLWMHELTQKRTGLPCERLLENGQELVLKGPIDRAFRVLHTPGHADGHLCLHDEASGALIAGDMVASVGTILIAPGEGHMATYLRELQRLENLGASVALPAHGAPIEQPSAHFRAYITHRLAREERVLHAFSDLPGHAGTLDELVRVAYADTPEALWPIAKLSLEAHLVKLEDDGLVEQAAQRWVRSKPA